MLYIMTSTLTVDLLFARNAKLYNKPDTLIYKTAGSILRKFEDYFEDFRGRQLQSAINSSKRSKRSLGTLISQKKRKDLLHTLLPSKGTLLVVPSTLLQHWEVSSFFLC